MSTPAASAAQASGTGPVVAIVGAGPAGLRAAEQLVAAGLRPVLLDEAPRVGGQIYRQPHPALQRPAAQLYGTEAHKATALFERWATLGAQVDHRPETLVWQIEHPVLHLLQQGRPSTLRADALILATGATDRVLPLPGWTLPGVLTLGAAQVALKAQASVLGPRVVLAGTGPLLFLVAWQLTQAGAQVQAVLDVAPPDAPLRALPQLLCRPAMAAKGALLLARLRLAGVPVHRGVTLLQVDADPATDTMAGHTRVAGVRWQQGGRVHTTACDAVALGHGLRSETQLADLAGCRFDWDAVDQAWLPVQDADGRSSVAGVYLAGDGAAIRGADAAERAGARAARAVLADLGRAAPGPALPRVAADETWRHALQTLCPLPDNWAVQAPDHLVVCRCEEITAGELRSCVRDTGTRELNRLKALTRIGMGRCQGRMCAPAAARLLAQAAQVPLADVGRLRAQPPVKPVPLQALAAVSPVPADQRDD